MLEARLAEQVRKMENQASPRSCKSLNSTREAARVSFEDKNWQKVFSSYPLVGQLLPAAWVADVGEILWKCMLADES